MTLTRTIRSKEDRERVKALIDQAPMLATVSIKPHKRTLPQNDIIHAMCSDIAMQLVWHGQKWPMEDWKKNLVACFKADLRIMPRADGFGVVPVGGTSDLSKDQASDFIEFIQAFAAQHGLSLNDHTEKAA